MGKFMTAIMCSSWLTFILSWGVAAKESSPCERYLKSKADFTVLSDAYAQWLVWEQSANIPAYRKHAEPLAFQYSLIPTCAVDIWQAPSIGVSIQNLFFRGGKVLWPKHPHNQNLNVPFSQNLNEVKGLRAFSTASRSAIPEENLAYSFKVPTDHAGGANGDIEVEKLLTRDEIRAARTRYEIIFARDKQLSPSPHVAVMPEVLTVADKQTGHGFLVRDISVLRDGHYYLPAFAIPYVGREIAKANRQPFETFWASTYAKALGQAKAELILRYGLQFETPNPQNILIQFDRRLKPTGKIIFRDVTDTNIVGPVAEAIGLREAIARDLRDGFNIDKKLLPHWEISRLHFAEDVEAPIGLKILDQWSDAHDEAYLQTIEKFVGRRDRGSKTFTNSLISFLMPYSLRRIERSEEVLFTAEGLDALKTSWKSP